MARQATKGKKRRKSWGQRVTPAREIMERLRRNPPRPPKDKIHLQPNPGP